MNGNVNPQVTFSASTTLVVQVPSQTFIASMPQQGKPSGRCHDLGNAIAADGKLFISMMDGNVIIANLNKEEYQELGRQQVTRGTRQAPSLSEGLLV